MAESDRRLRRESVIGTSCIPVSRCPEEIGRDRCRSGGRARRTARSPRLRPDQGADLRRKPRQVASAQRCARHPSPRPCCRRRTADRRPAQGCPAPAGRRRRSGLVSAAASAVSTRDSVASARVASASIRPVASCRLARIPAMASRFSGVAKPRTSAMRAVASASRSGPVIIRSCTTDRLRPDHRNLGRGHGLPAGPPRRCRLPAR